MDDWHEIMLLDIIVFFNELLFRGSNDWSIIMFCEPYDNLLSEETIMILVGFSKGHSVEQASHLSLYWRMIIVRQ